MNMIVTLAHYSYRSSRLPGGYIALVLAFALFVLIGEWRVYTKAGEPGWAVLIPIYNMWVFYRIVCGRGTAMFRLLIPIYNIYWAIKSTIKLAHAYGMGTGFGVLMLFFPPICEMNLETA